MDGREGGFYMTLIQKYRFPEKQTPAMRNWIYALIRVCLELNEEEKVIFT